MKFKSILKVWSGSLKSVKVKDTEVGEDISLIDFRHLIFLLQPLVNASALLNLF
jgi:hypothetical protein